MDVTLGNFPSILAERLGTTLFVGQLMASLIIIMLALSISLVAFKGKNAYASMIAGISAMCLTTALGWWPVWALIIVSLITALMFAGPMRDLLSGGKDDE